MVSNTTVCFSPKNGNIYNDNETWRLDRCTECTCRNGIVLCENPECPPVVCQNPVFDLNKDECCPRCLKEDKFSDLQFQKTSPIKSFWSCVDSHNQKRPHGSVWKEKNACVNCICINGENKCFHYENKCPRLNCARPILNKGQCCPYCLDSIDSPYILSNEILTNGSSLTPSKWHLSILPNIFILFLLTILFLHLK